MQSNVPSASQAISLQPGDLIDEQEAAAILSTEVRTLRNWRALRKGPRFHKIGQRMVRYHRVDLAIFISGNRGDGPSK